MAEQKNRGFLQPPITRDNVLVALEQCKDCLGISPVTAQGRKRRVASLKRNAAFRQMPTEKNVVRSCGTNTGNCIPYIGDPMVIAILKGGEASGNLQEV